MGGSLWEERERSGGRLPLPLGHRETAELLGGSPALQGLPSPSPGRIGPGAKGGRLGRSEEAGGRGPSRPQTRGTGEERRAFAHPLEPRKPAGLPGVVPCPLRPGVGGTPESLLFLEPNPYTPQPPGPFPPCGS